MIRKVAAIYVLGIFLAGLVFCGLAAGEELPVPEGAQLQNVQVKPVSGINYSFNFYAVEGSASSVADFYRRKLTGLGWEEVDLRKQLSGVPGYALNSEIAKAQSIVTDNNLLFNKGGVLLTITILPADRFSDRKTRFMLGQSMEVADPKIAPPPEIQEVLNPHTSVAQKYGIPQYPGANVLYSKEDLEKKTLVENYTTNDPVAKAFDFYKKEMRKSGWSVQEEHPASIIKAEDIKGMFEKAGSSCKSCAERAKTLKESDYPQGHIARLVFNKGETYSYINIVARDLEKDKTDVNLTHISVIYVEKPKQ